jgi:gluconokinase
MIIVAMGVSGSGKTTIGKMLADAIRCSFLEGDSLHSKENIEKMSHGIPLTDSDRAPWLTAIRAHILMFFKGGKDLVVACSALEQRYREFLAEGIPITWVYLKGSAEHIRSRMKHRPRHFMKADMLPSQFDARGADPRAAAETTDHPSERCRPLKRHSKSVCLGKEREMYPCLKELCSEAMPSKEVTNESHFGCAWYQDCPVSRPAGAIDLRA